MVRLEKDQFEGHVDNLDGRRGDRFCCCFGKIDVDGGGDIFGITAEVIGDGQDGFSGPWLFGHVCSLYLVFGFSDCSTLLDFDPVSGPEGPACSVFSVSVF